MSKTPKPKKGDLFLDGQTLMTVFGVRGSRVLATFKGSEEWYYLHEVVTGMNRLKGLLSKITDVDAHHWLCHPKGEECKDGCDTEADPERLIAYLSSK